MKNNREINNIIHYNPYSAGIGRMFLVLIIGIAAGFTMYYAAGYFDFILKLFNSSETKVSQKGVGFIISLATMIIGLPIAIIQQNKEEKKMEKLKKEIESKAINN